MKEKNITILEKSFLIFLLIIFLFTNKTFAKNVIENKESLNNQINNQIDNQVDNQVDNTIITEYDDANIEDDEQEDSNKIDELENKKSQIESLSEFTNSKLEFVQNEVTETVMEITQLSQNIYDKKTQMQEMEKKEEILNQEIADVTIELNEATELYNKKKDLLETRLVVMYESGKTSYLDLLLSSKGISEFISNYYYVSLITSADTELLNTVSEKKQNVENIMNELKKNEEELYEIQDNLKKETIALSNMVTIKDQKLKNLNAEETKLQQEIDEYQSQIQQVESEIKILSLISNYSEYVGGSFEWPVPGYSSITSKFGMRTHPITGIYKLHTGIDISAPIGATFVASNDGVVTKASYNTAYGNMVIVDHGGGISTLYAHGSEILVEVRTSCNSRNTSFKSSVQQVIQQVLMHISKLE